MKRIKVAMGPAGFLISIFALILASNVTVAFAAARITTSDIKNGAVTSAKIKDSSIVRPDIAGGAIGTLQLDDDAVTWEKLGKNSVSDFQLYDYAITTPKLDDLAVTTGKLGNGAVTGAKVAGNTLGGAQINEQALDFTGSCSRGLVRGFALVDLTKIPLKQWTVLPAPAYNCTGGTVQVYRNSAGKAAVQFIGLNSLYATVSPLGTWGSDTFSFPSDEGFQTTGHRPEAWAIRSGGQPAFYVQTWFGDELSNGRFVIMAF